MSAAALLVGWGMAFLAFWAAAAFPWAAFEVFLEGAADAPGDFVLAAAGLAGVLAAFADLTAAAAGLAAFTATALTAAGFLFGTCLASAFFTGAFFTGAFFAGALAAGFFGATAFLTGVGFLAAAFFAAGFTNLASAEVNFLTGPDDLADFAAAGLRATDFFAGLADEVLVVLAAFAGLLAVDLDFAATSVPVSFLRPSGRVL